MPTSKKIAYGHEFKQHRDISVTLNPDNLLMAHMYGRWCYEVASLTFIERGIANTFFSEPPRATYDEALVELQKAESFKESLGGWKSNKLWIGKTLIALSKQYDAIKVIDEALQLPLVTEEDKMVQIELEALGKKYCKYRK